MKKKTNKQIVKKREFVHIKSIRVEMSNDRMNERTNVATTQPEMEKQQHHQRREK